MKKRSLIIYLFSSLPLLVGSMIFFYWFYSRTWFAKNVEIELLAFFTIFGFLFFSLATMFLCVNFVLKHQTNWKKIIIPIIVLGLTIPVIELYTTLHKSLSDKVFVRIINDTDHLINRIWSDHFEITYFDDKEKDFVISYYPIYTYDWTVEFSSGMNYEVSKVKIDLKDNNGKISIYEFPEFAKNKCEIIRLTEFVKKE